MSRLRELAQNAGLSLGVSLGLLALVEGSCRVREHFRPPPPIAQFFSDLELRRDGGWYTVVSDDVGWPPGADFNAEGLRDVAHAPAKPHGVLRIAALGDSVTLGAGVEPREAWPQQLQQQVDAERRPVEVMSVALWGWSTREEHLAWGRIARRYAPDVAVLAVCLNDIPETLVDPPPAWIPRLHKRSALVRALVDAGGREMREVRGLFDPKSARAEKAWARFFDEVRALKAETAKDGAELVLVLFPFRFQVEPGAPAAVPQQRLLAFAQQEQLRALDLLPALQPLGAEQAFIDHDHLTPRGAEVTATTVRAWLRPRLPAPVVLPDDLVGAVRTGDDAVRIAAAREIAAQGVNAAAPALLDAIASAPQAVRWAAARAFGALGTWPPDALERLRPLLADRDPFVRTFALWGLGEIGAPAAVARPDLERALQRGVPAERRMAAQALGRLDAAAEPSVPLLVQALGDADAELRWRAARALGRIAARPGIVVPALVAALSDPKPEVRGQAARALGRFGPAAGSALAALREREKDAEATVRTHARAARAAIESGRRLD